MVDMRALHSFSTTAVSSHNITELSTIANQDEKFRLKTSRAKARMASLNLDVGDHFKTVRT